jgi:hypothetical protein
MVRSSEKVNEIENLEKKIEGRSNGEKLLILLNNKCIY